MKALLLISTVLGISLMTQSADAQIRYVATDNSVTSTLCVKAASGRKGEFRFAMRNLPGNRDSASKMRLVAKTVKCNGVPIALFSYQAGNYAVAKLINSKLPSEVRYAEISALDKL